MPYSWRYQPITARREREEEERKKLDQMARTAASAEDPLERIRARAYLRMFRSASDTRLTPSERAQAALRKAAEGTPLTELPPPPPPEEEPRWKKTIGAGLKALNVGEERIGGPLAAQAYGYGKELLGDVRRGDLKELGKDVGRGLQQAPLIATPFGAPSRMVTGSLLDLARDAGAPLPETGLERNYERQERAYQRFQQNERVPIGVRVAAGIALDPSTYVGPGVVKGALKAPKVAKALGKVPGATMTARVAAELAEGVPPSRAPLFAAGAGAGVEVTAHTDVPLVPEWVEGLGGGFLGGGITLAGIGAMRSRVARSRPGPSIGQHIRGIHERVALGDESIPNRHELVALYAQYLDPEDIRASRDHLLGVQGRGSAQEQAEAIFTLLRPLANGYVKSKNLRRRKGAISQNVQTPPPRPGVIAAVEFSGPTFQRAGGREPVVSTYEYEVKSLLAEAFENDQVELVLTAFRSIPHEEGHLLWKNVNFKFPQSVRDEAIRRMTASLETPDVYATQPHMLDASREIRSRYPQFDWTNPATRDETNPEVLMTPSGRNDPPTPSGWRVLRVDEQKDHMAQELFSEALGSYIIGDYTNRYYKAYGDLVEVVMRSMTAEDKKLFRDWAEAYRAITPDWRPLPPELAVGAPDGIETMRDLAVLRNVMDEVAAQGEDVREWYGIGGEWLLKASGGDKRKAMRNAAILSFSSGAQGVSGQGITGPRGVANAILTGKADITAANQIPLMQRVLDAIESGTEQDIITVVQDLLTAPGKKGRPKRTKESGKDYFRGPDGTLWEKGESPKLGAYFLSFLDVIDPSLASRIRAKEGIFTVVDRWMVRAYGYVKEGEGEEALGRLTEAQRYFIDADVQRIARMNGWTYHEAQSAIWAATKTHWEKTDIQFAGLGYEDVIRRENGVMSWESTPTQGTWANSMLEKIGFANLPYIQRVVFHQMVSAAVHGGGQGAHDPIARALGILTGQHQIAPGVWWNPELQKLEVNPVSQIPTPLPAGKRLQNPYRENQTLANRMIDPAAREVTRIHAALKAWATEQWGIGVTRTWDQAQVVPTTPKEPGGQRTRTPVPDETGYLRNGRRLELGRSATPEEAGLIAQRLGDQYVVINNADGVLVYHLPTDWEMRYREHIAAEPVQKQQPELAARNARLRRVLESRARYHDDAIDDALVEAFGRPPDAKWYSVISDGLLATAEEGKALLREVSPELREAVLRTRRLYRSAVRQFVRQHANRPARRGAGPVTGTGAAGPAGAQPSGSVVEASGRGAALSRQVAPPGWKPEWDDIVEPAVVGGIREQVGLEALPEDFLAWRASTEGQKWTEWLEEGGGGLPYMAAIRPGAGGGAPGAGNLPGPRVKRILSSGAEFPDATSALVGKATFVSMSPSELYRLIVQDTSSDTYKALVDLDQRFKNAGGSDAGFTSAEKALRKQTYASLKAEYTARTGRRPVWVLPANARENIASFEEGRLGAPTERSHWLQDYISRAHYEAAMASERARLDPAASEAGRMKAAKQLESILGSPSNPADAAAEDLALHGLEVMQYHVGVDTLYAIAPPPSAAAVKAAGPTTQQKVSVTRRIFNWANLIDALNAPRVAVAAADASFLLRQGVILGGNFPKEWATATKAMWEAAKSPEGAQRITDAMRSTPEYDAMKDVGLEFSDWAGDAASLGKREEMFMSTLAEKIPIWGSQVIKRSGRANTVFINKLRHDAFLSLVHDWPEWQGLLAARDDHVLMQYRKSPEFGKLRQAAKLVNAASGRGNVSLGPLSNVVFFSPKFVMSRLELIKYSLDPGVDPEVRKLAARMMGLWLAQTGTALTLMSFIPGVDVETNPASSDFGKVQVGQQRWDFFAGYSQLARFGFQMASGKGASLGSKQSQLLGGLSWSKETHDVNRGEVLTRFVRGKMAPGPSMVYNLLKGETFLGEEYRLTGTTEEFGGITLPAAALVARDAVMPMWMQDTVDAFVRGDAVYATSSALGGFTGVTNYTIPDSYKELDKLARERGAESWRKAKPSERAAIREAHPDVWESYIAQAGPLKQKEEGIRREILGKMQALDRQLLEGGIPREDWAKAVSGLRAEQFTRVRGVYEELSASTSANSDPLLGEYYRAIDSYRNAETGQVDWLGVQEWLETLPQSERQYIDENTGLGGTPLGRYYSDIRSAYYGLPKYKGFTATQSARIDDIYNTVRARSKSSDNWRMLRSLRLLGEEGVEMDEDIRSAVRKRILGVLREDSAREKWRKQNPVAYRLLGNGAMGQEEASEMLRLVAQRYDLTTYSRAG